MDFEPHTQDKLRIAKAMGTSKRCNTRNLECPSYALFSLWLQEVVRDRPNLVVVPQYNLWYETGQFNAQDELAPDDGDDEDEAELENPLADLSTDSTRTLALMRELISERFPDFVVLHIMAQPVPANHPRFALLEGVWITGESCPLVLECKRAPKHRASQENPAAISIRLSAAKHQLFESCTHAFQKYRSPALAAQEIMAVATAGMYWTYVIVTRENIVTKDHWDALVWHGVVANQYYRLQFEPRVGVQDEATLVVRDFLMNYAPLEHALPGAPPAE